MRPRHPDLKDSPTLRLVEKVSANIKKAVTSSNDIIPRHLMPLINESIRDERSLKPYIKQFGAVKIQEFFRYTEYLRLARDASMIFTNLPRLGLTSPETTVNLIISQSGIGECAEVTTRFACEYIKAGGSSVDILVLEGKLPDYSHAIAIVGDINGLTSDLRSFEKLSDDCILVDIFLGIIGPAKQTVTLLNDYIKAHQLDRTSTGASKFMLPTQFTQQHRQQAVNQLNESARYAMGFRSIIGNYRKPDNQKVTRTLTEARCVLFSGKAPDQLAEASNKEATPVVESLLRKNRLPS